MEYLPAVIVISSFFFTAAYGIQKRRRWAWYLGWLAALVFGGAICAIVLSGVEGIGTSVNPVGFALVTVGATTVWTSWAIWWYRNRGVFGIRGKEVD